MGVCGRYVIYDDRDIEEINKIINEVNDRVNNTGSMAVKVGEVFPTNNAPILSLVNNKPSINIMRWGFPKWDGKGAIINAKSETAADKKMFAKSLRERRCVIPSTGFFEWQKKDAPKNTDKYLFTTDDSPMLYMAGLYNTFKVEDEEVESFTILTCAANKYISDLHDRMPVILFKNELVSWLREDDFIHKVFERDNVILKREIV